MKLGVSFIAFSGLELLKPALLNVREEAAWINIVYQTVSHLGIPAPEYIEDLLSDLKREGLVERLLLFQPPLPEAATPIAFQLYQYAKREMGRKDCQQVGCTHVMIRDCDEFYRPDQFRWALEKSVGFDVTYVSSVDYARFPLVRCPHISQVCVPFVHRVDLPLGKARLPFRVDPARIVAGDRRQRGFPAHRIVMHHMSRVRFDREELDRKYESHSWAYEKADVLRKRAAEWENLDPRRYLWLERDSFGILEYWEKEFRKYKRCEGELPAFKMAKGVTASPC